MSDDPEKPFTCDFLMECNCEHDWFDDFMFNDGLHEMTDEEWFNYGKQVSESNGFDVNPLFGVFAIGIICPFDLDHDPELLHQCINLAIKEYSKKNNGKKLKLKEPVKWNWKVVCPVDYYITFTAEYEETREVKTNRAKVVDQIPKEETYVEMVRVKPKKRLPDTSPPEASSNKKLSLNDID